MFQRFTEEEAEELKKLRPTGVMLMRQLGELKELSHRAASCSSQEALRSIREGLLQFRENLGPDDDTYDVVIDPMVDNKSLDLLCYLNMKISGIDGEADRYLPNFH